jgi:hypothetical protein
MGVNKPKELSLEIFLQVCSSLWDSGIGERDLASCWWLRPCVYQIPG